MNEPSAAFTAASARRAARNMGAMAAAQILSKGALFIWQLILIPLLGPQEYGVYGTVGALLLIGVAVTSFGMGNIIIRDVARRRDLAGDYLSSALFLQTILALLTYLGVQLAAALLGYAPEVRSFLAIAGLSLFVDMFGTLCFEQLQAQEKMVTTAMSEIIHVIVRIALAGLALVAGYGLLGVYVMTLIASALRAAILWGALLRTGVRPRYPIQRSLSVGLLRDGAPGAATALVTTGYQNADRLVTASLIGSQAVGYLSAAFVIVFGVVEMLSTTVLIVVYPLLARISRAGSDMARFRRVVESLAHFTFVGTLPIVLAISVYSDALVSVLGIRYAQTADILRVMIWYAFVAITVNIYVLALLVQNRQQVTFVIRSGGLLLNLGLLLLLLPRLGVIGAPIASIIGETVVLVLLIPRFLQGAPTTRSLRKTLRVCVAALAGGCVMLLLRSIQPALLGAFIGGAAGLVVYGASVHMLRGLNGDDWAMLRPLIEALPGGGRLVRWLPR